MIFQEKMNLTREETPKMPINPNPEVGPEVKGKCDQRKLEVFTFYSSELLEFVTISLDYTPKNSKP